MWHLFPLLPCFLWLDWPMWHGFPPPCLVSCGWVGPMWHLFPLLPCFLWLDWPMWHGFPPPALFLVAGLADVAQVPSPCLVSCGWIGRCGMGSLPLPCFLWLGWTDVAFVPPPALFLVAGLADVAWVPSSCLVSCGWVDRCGMGFLPSALFPVAELDRCGMGSPSCLDTCDPTNLRNMNMKVLMRNSCKTNGCILPPPDPLWTPGGK